MATAMMITNITISCQRLYEQEEEEAGSAGIGIQRADNASSPEEKHNT